MNTKKDIQKIVQDYYFDTGAQMEKHDDPTKTNEVAQQAENQFAEGLKQLEQLKLSAADRRNLKVLKDVFINAILAMQEIQRDNPKKAEKYGEKSKRKAYLYAKLKGFKVGGSK